MIRSIDLFAGIGGLRLALDQVCGQFGVDHRCVFSSEINKRARETYEMNFGELPAGDITTIERVPAFDFLLAGFPCQPFSHAGQHKGFDDTRGTLFYEIARILRDHRPRGFLLENVRGLTTNDGGRTFAVIVETLEGLGYGVRHVLLNTCNFGVPQNRLRVYVVGLLEGDPKLTLQTAKGPADSHEFKNSYAEMLFSQPHEYPHRTVKDILQSRAARKYACSQMFVEMLSRVVDSDFEKLHGVRLIDYRGGNSIHSWELGLKGECSDVELRLMNSLIANRRRKEFGRHQDGKKLTLEQIRSFYNPSNLEEIVTSLIGKGYLKQHGDRYDPVCGNMSFEVFKFLDPESISITLTSSDAHRLGVVQQNVPRRITPRECARLQGFPETFKRHPIDSCAYTQFGNSVSVPVVRAVLADLLAINPELVGRASHCVPS